MLLLASILTIYLSRLICADEVLGCGGFVKSHVPIDFSKVVIRLYTKQGILKDQTTCAPNNGYYFIPIYDKGEYNLQLESPLGWTFEPVSVNIVMDGKTDLCSQGQDINYVFKGFGIAGRVGSLASDKGPVGVTVELVSASADSPVRSTTTTTNGSFFFTLVYPGDYDIRISHPHWKISKRQVKIQVSESDTQLPPNSLMIAGYDVNGVVSSNGIPTPGVHFMLYAKNQKAKDVTISDCKQTNIGPISHQAAFLCYVTSDNDGQFNFPSIPTGTYIIVPQFDDGTTAKRQVYFSPESIEFVVNHDTLHLPQPFEIIAFSVSGKVLQVAAGQPLTNAKVLFDDKFVGTTNAAGIYNIDRITSGTYKITVLHDEFEFDPAVVVLSHSPATSTLDILYPARYRVCGTVASELAQTIAITKVGSTQHVTIASAPTTGTFCQFLRPGKYQFEILDKNRAGEHFYPRTQKVEVGLGQKTGVINFTQLKAIVRGAVRCFAKTNDCHNIKVILRPATNAGEHVHEVIQHLQNGAYKFTDIRPGSYVIYLTSNRLCWNLQKQDVVVTSFEYTVPDFVQTGYSISILSSHDTQVKYHQLNAGKSSEETQLTVLRNTAKVQCLPSPGNYIFTPRSCHGYNPTSYTLQTENQQNELILNAVSHVLTGYIRSEHPESKRDILTVEVAEISGEPLKLTYKGDVKGYPFAFQLTPKERRTLKPISDTFLFTPNVAVMEGTDDCLDMGEVIVAKRGKLFTGLVQPTLVNVEITLTNGAQEWKALTDSQGKYRFAPVPNIAGYAIAAQKDSYVLTGPDTNGHFHAHKLAEVHIRVLDLHSEQPLQGALVSLSGGESYRRNLQTDKNGFVSFQSLSPSEYFLRPVMKEYNFEPLSQMITVAEGATVNIKLTGKRVSYSAYGVITSLNNDPEEDVSVIAAGVGNCSHFSEETTSEPNGSFRIRGLVPWCQYDLRVHSSSLALPETEQVKLKVNVQTSDVRGLHLIAFRPCSSTEFLVSISTSVPIEQIRGNVFLKVLRPDGNAAYSTKVDILQSQTLVHIPAVPMDNTIYMVCVESYPQQCNAHAQETEYMSTIVANTSFHFVRLFLAPITGQGNSAEYTQPPAKPPTFYALLALLACAGCACAVYNRDWVEKNGLVLIEVVTAYLQPRRSDGEGKGSSPVQEIDTSDIDQIVQSINATKKRTVKPKRI